MALLLWKMKDVYCSNECSGTKRTCFVDSMTTANSVGDAVCHKKIITILKKMFFLDSTDEV